MNAGQDGCKTGYEQDSIHSGQDERWTGWKKDRMDAGLDGRRTVLMQVILGEGSNTGRKVCRIGGRRTGTT